MRSIQALFGVALLAGCPGPNGVDDAFARFDDADLADAEAVAVIASTASAPNAYVLTVLLAGLLDPEVACPVATEEGDATVFTGGCTDEEGFVWEGRAVVEQSGTGAGEITYEDFGGGGSDDCTGGGTVSQRSILNGTVTLGDDGTFSISITGAGNDVDVDACTASADEEFALEFDGQQVEQTDDLTIWSGSGRYGSSVWGKADVETADEHVDDTVCSSEAASGTTTLRTPGHTAVITYDGATDCDVESTVTWALDGTDMGELTGISCRTAPGSFGVLALLALLGLVRRR